MYFLNYLLEGRLFLFYTEKMPHSALKANINFCCRCKKIYWQKFPHIENIVQHWKGQVLKLSYCVQYG